MKQAGTYQDSVTAYERSLSRARLYEHPSRWTGKWILGRMVYVLYQAIEFALFFEYRSRARVYEYRLPWTGKWMLGRMASGLYQAIEFALFIGYYEFFRPWRKLAP